MNDQQRAAMAMALEAMGVAHDLSLDEWHFECRQTLLEAITALREALAQPQGCHHRIADARNPIVKSGYMCVDCGALFSAADHTIQPVVPQEVTEGNASEVRSTDTGEPVAWQFFQDGKWWNGSEYNCHRQNTEDAGIPVRNLYTNPPSVEDMRIETLEKAAKMCDGMSDLAERQELKPRASFYRQCAAAIRSMK
jgi:hypothetical protein